MPIDVDRVVGAELPTSTFSWEEDDVILYHLGIGAGNPPTDPGELRYVYEADLHVLPTYVTIPQFATMVSLAAIEGLDITLAQILHGEHEILLSGAIPTSGAVTQTGRVTHVYDKGKGALVVVEIDSAADGEVLFTNRASIYVRGEGGFGGDGGPPLLDPTPDRAPDHVVESPTLPQQALLYRMVSGDKNPLHADPAFAAFAGFDRPILHGLCTYGVVAKAAVDHALGGEPSRVVSYRARFSGVVYPGETVLTRIWEEEDRLVLAAETKERADSVLSHGVMVKV